MTHDPLCPLSQSGKHLIDTNHAGTHVFCIDCERECHCETIAKVRADERKQAGQRVESLRGAKGVTLAVAAAVASGNSDVAVGW